ncbi:MULTISPECIES: RteC domain-containing protein [Bacteroidota]|uniref:Tetracycline regulation of excision, RteC n=2 Tax=Bacteroidota TaxID=976 RepID=A0A101CH68_9FLAO|nr:MULTISPECIES: RteC domain-containing protein [Bacteroidota]KUJ56148.1 tetracycline regulation of excision, RteC [Chryseobacterium aquaticum subsp. greenlandense]MBE8722505.1 tetracycline regulation of excision, RteC [Sphingobacterium pedocola]
MEKCYNDILFKLEVAINDLEIETDYSIQRIETAIKYIISSLSELKQFVIKKDFKSIQEEIYFFKHQKPVIVSKLIYYNAIYKIETKKPYGTKCIRKYFTKELKKLKRFFDNNLDFYKYYRSHNSFLDENFFVREKHDIRLWLDTFYFEADHRFSTSHDYKVAKIIANDLIQVYIEDQLNSINKQRKIESSMLTWTASKTDLTELIYALYAQGVFGNGKADIKLIVKSFESFCNIDLGDFYRTYLELKNRKLNRTKFLDTMHESLLKKMDEQDER